MILRRVTEHVRNQEWTAIAIDFVIVVVGVFVGIQVSNWNGAKVEAAQLDEQLRSLRLEMEDNRVRIAEHRAAIQSQYDDAAALRASFAADTPDPDPDQTDARLMNVYRIVTFVPERNAYQDLADTGGLRRLAGTPLRETIASWDATLAAVQRMNTDALMHRSASMPDLTSRLAIGAMLEHFPSPQGDVPRSRFRNDPQALAQDRALDNYLAVRLGVNGATLLYLDQLEQETNALIDALRAHD